jgi:hypothetical protein
VDIVSEVMGQDAVCSEPPEVDHNYWKDSRNRFIQMMEEKRERDAISELASAERKGLKKGLEKGRRAGLKEGRVEGRVEGLQEGLMKGQFPPVGHVRDFHPIANAHVGRTNFKTMGLRLPTKAPQGILSGPLTPLIFSPAFSNSADEEPALPEPEKGDDDRRQGNHQGGEPPSCHPSRDEHSGKHVPADQKPERQNAPKKNDVPQAAPEKTPALFLRRHLQPPPFLISDIIKDESTFVPVQASYARLRHDRD